MNKILQIARREYLETVKTKAFLIGLLVLPVFIVGIVVIGGKMQKKAFTGPREDIQLAVVNLDQELDQELKDAFDSYNEDNPGRRVVPHYVEMTEEKGKEAVRDEDFDGLLFVQESTVQSEGHAKLFTRGSSDVTLESIVRGIVNRAASNARYTLNGLSPELVRKLSRGVWLEDIEVSEKGESRRNRMVSMMLPFFFMMLMFFGIMTASQGLLNSVIEEKNNRVMEVLLSAVSPLDMMSGKILGQSMIAMTMVAIYAGGSLGAAKIAGFGEMLNNIGTPELVLFLVYYVLGFLLFNSLFAAIGSAFNSLREAQSFISPVMMLIISPFFIWTLIVQQPSGTLAVVTSLVPPLSPMVMVMRVAAMPSIPWLQVAASLAILALAVVAVVWAASRVFRVGILMFGKPPTLREIIRWVRE